MSLARYAKAQEFESLRVYPDLRNRDGVVTLAVYRAGLTPIEEPLRKRRLRETNT